MDPEIDIVRYMDPEIEDTVRNMDPETDIGRYIDP
jgi:hypothetical protein